MDEFDRTSLAGYVVRYELPSGPRGPRTFPLCMVRHSGALWESLPHTTFEHALLSTPGVAQVEHDTGALVYVVTVRSDASGLTADRARQLVAATAERCWVRRSSEVA